MSNPLIVTSGYDGVGSGSAISDHQKKLRIGEHVSYSKICHCVNIFILNLQHKLVISYILSMCILISIMNKQSSVFCSFNFFNHRKIIKVTVEIGMLHVSISHHETNLVAMTKYDRLHNEY